ncbi:Guanine nucleotide exchange factor for Cdc42p [Taxawa tesnikishii (nom. ined.)]|nr:Guanine nucleotide exchange factor for Cdc42p [Dothideales sp. JES 119]
MSATGPSPLIHSQNYTGSTYSLQSQPSAASRSSDTTQGTTHSTLFGTGVPGTPAMPPTPLPTPANGGRVEASNNIMNTVADKDNSLFQICLTLKKRLTAVPGYEGFMDYEENNADEDVDPVTLLWRVFRKGKPLVYLYNTLMPDKPIDMDNVKMANEFNVEDCFIIYDLYGDDTTGFVKVIRMVSRILDILVAQGIIEDKREDDDGTASGKKLSQREHIVDELVRSERTYVQHLELLQAFKQLCEKKGIIPGDVVHAIFLNLNALLDFQRRFLIRIYEPYIANQKLCEETVIREFDKLKEAGGSPEMQQIVVDAHTLNSFLMKPFQRLTKYPLLLEQLNKHGDLDEARKANLEIGIECARAVLTRTNEAIAHEDKLEAVHDLKNRVEDWKGHRVEGFGDLLLFGTFTVIKSDAAPTKDMEREYHVYFFESILLCCKDINPNKPKNKMSAKPLVDKRGKLKLQLKGRIFMQNVTDLIKASKAGTYTVQIFWKGDPGIENFVIKFKTEAIMDTWYTRLLEMKNINLKNRSSTDLRPSGPSSTEFTFMKQQSLEKMENPYRQEEEDEDEVDTVVSPASSQNYPSQFDYQSSRNASSTSLRSRSTTGDSGPTIPSSSGHMPPPRLPPGSLAGLSLRTQHLQNGVPPSPAERAMMDSYFSPTIESPISSRTSGSSSMGMYPFPRQPVPNNGYYEEGHGRYTAPAMGRTTSREVSNGSGNYPQSARAVNSRPSYPNGVGQPLHSAQQLPPSRNRSASSPNINEVQRRVMNDPAPPMPGMPAYPNHLAQNPNAIPRSQSNSPALGNGVPSRAAGAQSPKSRRERSHTRTRQDSPHYAYDGASAPPSAASSRPDLRLGSIPSSRSITPIPYGAREHTISPPLPSATPLSPPDSQQPTQLKVKVHATAANQILTLVVPLNISFQSLKDRIDAKLQRSTNISLSDRGANQVKLKYLDEDDYVSIQSDEDVQTAFETWKEQRGERIGGMGEIELFCQ